jgi:enterochelin esterase family protein
MTFILSVKSMSTPINRSVSILLLLLLAILPTAAQTPATNSTAERRPARGFGFGPPPVQSPEVSADKRVTFRLRAPTAKEVAVTGITRQPIPMDKNDEGVWSATTEPLNADLYEYAFVVDGLSIVDPANMRFRPSYQRVRSSAVLVPGEMPWTPLTNAARGAIARHVFQSKLAKDEREVFVYTPPNYDPKRRRPYPVLYLLHGLGDDAKAWIEVGAANVTLDTLINQGKAEPMVMVNPLGYGNADGPAGHRREDMLPTFARILIEEVMPQVEKQYNASRNRKDRAVAGLSMGGAEATLTGLNHLDKFAWIGSFSGAYNRWPLTRPPERSETTREAPAGRNAGRGRLALEETQLPKTFPQLDKSSTKQIQMLWITCGTSDVLIGVNRQFKTYLDSKGVNATYTEIPDAGHVWPLWRQNLADFAPLLFK